MVEQPGLQPATATKRIRPTLQGEALKFYNELAYSMPATDEGEGMATQSQIANYAFGMLSQVEQQVGEAFDFLHNSGAGAIAVERWRQQNELSYTIENDRLYRYEQLRRVAVFLLTGDWEHWPDWNRKLGEKWMKKPYQERLVIAGAFLAAEWDRVNDSTGERAIDVTPEKTEEFSAKRVVSINDLLEAGFVIKSDEWKDVWGQGDGQWRHVILRRGDLEIETTSYIDTNFKVRLVDSGW